MFENLSDRLSKVVKNLRGQGRLTETNIQDALREVRVALLEADVALPVVRDFIARVKEKAMGQEVLQSLTPGQQVAIEGAGASGLVSCRTPAVTFHIRQASVIAPGRANPPRPTPRPAGR